MAVRTLKRRRRIVVRVAVASFLLVLTACIFDRSTYEGGGRLGQGGSSIPEPTATDTATSATSLPIEGAGADAGKNAGTTG